MGRAQRKRAAPQAQAAPPKASAAKRKKAQKLRQKADALEKRAALYAALADNGASGDDLRVVRAAVAGARAGGTARQRATAALLKERRGLALDADDADALYARGGAKRARLDVGGDDAGGGDAAAGGGDDAAAAGGESSDDGSSAGDEAAPPAPAPAPTDVAAAMMRQLAALQAKPAPPEKSEKSMLNLLKKRESSRKNKQYSPDKIEKWFSVFDVNDDKTISRSEFVAALTRSANGKNAFALTEDHAEALFDEMDEVPMVNAVGCTIVTVKLTAARPVLGRLVDSSGGVLPLHARRLALEGLHGRI